MPDARHGVTGSDSLAAKVYATRSRAQDARTTVLR